MSSQKIDFSEFWRFSDVYFEEEKYYNKEEKELEFCTFPDPPKEAGDLFFLYDWEIKECNCFKDYQSVTFVQNNT